MEVKRGVDAIYKSPPLLGTVKNSPSGCLTCSQIIHAVIPPYVDGKEREVNYVDSVLQQILQGATPSNSNSILITPFTCHPCSYPIDLCAQRLLQVINQSQSQLGIYSDITIMVFVEDMSHKAVFKECMNQWEYTIISTGQRVVPHPSISLPVSPPRAVGSSEQKALADSLASVVRITKGSMLDVQVCKQNYYNKHCAFYFTGMILLNLLG